MAIRQTKTSGIDNLMQEMETQAAEQQEAVITAEHIEALKQLNGTLAESIAELDGAKYRVMMRGRSARAPINASGTLSGRFRR